MWGMEIECEVLGNPYLVDNRTVGFICRDLTNNCECTCHTPSYDNASDVLRNVGDWRIVKLEGDFVGEVFRIRKLIN